MISPNMTLHDAIKAGNLEQVRKLLAEGADVQSPGNDGLSPLQLAAHHKHLDLVRLLARAGGDPRELAELDLPIRIELLVRLHREAADREPATEAGDMMSGPELAEWLFETAHELLEQIDLNFIFDNSPLFQAVVFGDLETVKARIKAGDDLNEIREAEEDTPLLLALELGHGDIALELIAAGVDVHSGADQDPPFSHALDDLQVARALIRAGADVDRWGQDGLPIMEAVARSDFFLVRLLLEAGANPPLADQQGDTFLLDEAIQAGEWAIYQELLPHFAEEDVLLARDFCQDSPTADSEENSLQDLLSLTSAAQLGQIEKVRNLLREGQVEINDVGWPGNALIMASARPHLHVMQFLLDEGADVGVTAPKPAAGMSATTALAAAVHGGGDGGDSLAAVRLLLEHGADPNQRGSDLRRTALMHAVLAAYRSDAAVEAVALLLEAGADTELEDDLGYSAWMLARVPLIQQDEKTRAPRRRAKRNWDLDLSPGRSKKKLKSRLKRCRRVSEQLEQAGAVTRDLVGIQLLGAIEADNAPRVRELLESGASPDFRDPDGAPPVVLAAENESSQILAELISADCDIDVKRPQCWTALDNAINNDRLTIIRQLLAAGANPKNIAPIDRDGPHSPLTRAEAAGNDELAQLLRKIVPIKPPFDYDGPEMTAGEKRVCELVRESAEGHLEKVRELARADATLIDAIDIYGRSALAAAAESGHLEIMRVLIDAGADLNRGNQVEASPRSTPLIAAAISPAAHRDTALRLLLEAGADPNLPGADGRTALMLAVERDVGLFGRTGNFGLSTRTLIEAGAELERQDTFGLTAWMHARSLAWSFGDAEIDELYGALARLLEEAGASTSRGADVELVRLATGPLPLLRRSSLGYPFGRRSKVDGRDPEQLTELLHRDANPDARRHDGATALLMAVRGRRPEIVQILLEAGCDPNAHERGEYGCTALCEATVCGDYEITRLLLEAGADPALRSDPSQRSSSPRALAAARRHHRIAQLLGEPIQVTKSRLPGPFILGG